MNEWFEKEWAGIAQIFKIRRSVKEGEKEREEMVYGFSNFPRKKANAKRLLKLNQQHWFIENRLHYRRDVTLGEDSCQIRINGAPQSLAALNGGILALMDWLGITNVANLCASSRSFTIAAWQAFAGKRVNRKALSYKVFVLRLAFLLPTLC